MRRNPRIMPVSESDLNSLTHKAIQILRTGLAYKLRREQQFWERKRKRNEEAQREAHREILEESGTWGLQWWKTKDFMFDESKFTDIYPNENSKINYKGISEYYPTTLVGHTVINQAGFVYQDIRGQNIDSLLQVVAKKGAKHTTQKNNIYIMDALDVSKIVSKPRSPEQQSQTAAWYAIVANFVGEGRQMGQDRLVGSKIKQNILQVDFNVQNYSFRSVFTILGVPKNSFAYSVLFNAVKHIVYHEFIHSMESFPQEYMIEEYRRQSTGEVDFNEWLKSKTRRPTGNTKDPDYYDQLKERRAFLSQVLNEILYYNTHQGILQQAFYTKRPEDLAESSPQFRTMHKEMSEDTAYYYYQAIYQFQKEYDPATFVHYTPLNRTMMFRGKEVIKYYWNYKGGKKQNQQWEKSLEPKIYVAPQEESYVYRPSFDEPRYAEQSQESKDTISMSGWDQFLDIEDDEPKNEKEEYDATWLESLPKKNPKRRR